jgi:hypothetical protein
MYGNQGDDTLKGGKGDDVITGGQGSDVLAGGSGRNSFGDERDGSIDKITIKMDANAPDQMRNLDKKDRIVVKPVAGLDDAGFAVSPVEIANMEAVQLIELGGQAVAYYTGGNLSDRNLLSMLSLG